MFWIGTSGYNYPEWRGSFYPATLPAARMLGFYAARFASVEINYSFYRLPAASVLAGWARDTPDGFRFTLKAPQGITHKARLRQCRELTERFCELASTLGDKLGVLLFQLPPNLKKDAVLLEEFLDTLPRGTRAAFEFRHASWHDEEVLGLLRARQAALCVADSEKMSTPVAVTAPFAYFRLRDEGYQAADVARWGDTIRERTAGCANVYVYFKHEEEGKGPEFARLLVDHLKD
jgi:uncharacterized protein YecE (DUF72 family)